MLYNSKKGKLLGIIMCFFLVMTIVAIINEMWPLIIILIIVSFYFVWTWMDTYYIIRDGQLFYKSAFIKGSVPISAMHEIIRHNKGLHSCSLKPALAIKGLIIKYNRWDDMFVSPQNAEEFIAELRAINPNITVTG